MMAGTQPTSSKVFTIALKDFGELQTRYQSLPLASRAAAVLEDAELALEAAQMLLDGLSIHPQIQEAFTQLRNNALIIGKMRSSEAKTMLLDGSDDFITATGRKLAAWRRTMERLSQGEGVQSEKNREFIPASEPVAMAIVGSANPSGYLSIVQLAVSELGRIDAANVGRHTATLAEIRRCATVLADCEHASGIQTVVH